MMVNKKIYQPLADEMMKKANDEKIPTIVVFKSKDDTADKDNIKKILKGQNIKYEYHIIPGIAVDLTKSQIEEISKMENVEYIEIDGMAQAHLNTARPWFGVDKAVSDFNVTGNKDGSSQQYSKNDVVIAVLDTGIDTGHVDLGNGKVIGWHDLVNAIASPYDDNGHGTHVASIAAGAGIGKWKYRGVAYGAALVGVKILDSTGFSPNSRIIAGIEWCVDHKDEFGIDIMNMSLGNFPPNAALRDAANNAVDAGIVVCVSAANSGPATGTIASPGDAEKVITVGAMADVGKGGFNLASFSSRGPTSTGIIKPDICGPGVEIMGAMAGTTTGYVSFNGTSMACPFVAGVAALILDGNPTLTPLEVKDILTLTAQDWDKPGIDVDYGYGRLDAYKAIKRAIRSCHGKNIALPNLLYAQNNLPAPNTADWYEFEVCEKCTPVAITMIMPDWTGPENPDFNIRVYDPFGMFVAQSLGTTRQETIKFTAHCTGKYKIQVDAFRGSGDYFFNISVFGKDLELIENNVTPGLGAF